MIEVVQRVCVVLISFLSVRYFVGCSRGAHNQICSLRSVEKHEKHNPHPRPHDSALKKSMYAFAFSICAMNE